MSDLDFDEQGVAGYYDHWIRKPDAPMDKWVCSTTFWKRGFTYHDTVEGAMQHARNERAAGLRAQLAELESLGLDGEIGYMSLPRPELEARCGLFEDILRTVCHHLELPQSESGPADDVRLYDRALADLDAYADEADKDLARTKDLRFAAEANVERLLKAAAPLVDAARQLPDPRSLVEGSTLWAMQEARFIKALAGVEQDSYRTLMGTADAALAANRLAEGAR